MFLISSKLCLSRSLPFIYTKKQRPIPRGRPTGAALLRCAHSATATVHSPSKLVESSVVPAGFIERQQSYRAFISSPQPPLAYELLQGSLVRHCDVGSTSPPTIVLVHGILGSKKNLQAFAKRILEGFPSWQAILVDLRCHGESHCDYLEPRREAHSVQSAANDILQLLNYLKIFPRVLIGHSFGGKVVMSMAHQFGQTLPRPVQAWILDTLPGEISINQGSVQDHPFDLIQTLQSIPLPVRSRSDLIQRLSSSGFSTPVAQWMTTNLRPTSERGFEWTFDLQGIEDLYRSYESSSLWPLLYAPPVGLSIDFVRAEHSHFRWTDRIQHEIEALGHQVHLLRDSGHWVHTDNPEGLFQILKQTLGDEAFAVRLRSFA